VQFARKFAAPFRNRFCNNIQYYYNNLLGILNLQALHNSHRHSDALFLINVYNGAKCCPSVLETVDIHVSVCYLRNSAAPSVTVLQLDMFLLLMEFINVHIFLETYF
jgi:hypothetical protein